ncbi:DNA mismatch endonuclease, patch repair protein [Enterococcus sp. DIV0840]|uniref:very short patch repair endonuclease n=1 Tax=unclassified Enterococcus TaxID=2608891 RepID=UPI001A8F7F55|nr:very short patch repair endonuclease [Enterococcus sp. DIV0849a]MBO0433930.1 DNA mismatch endonuclease Vsr [Enterococcus sp. DIV0849a]
MTDHLSKEKRSWNMSKIRSTDSKPEEIVRKFLYSNKIGYRKNVKELPGKPDLVLKKYNTVIFVNGCFWHCHQGCSRFRLPKSNQQYWSKKLAHNVERDN